ncbi:hypothetical protein [Streptomyces narbonensis]|nr:hypothetical protein [Streptomyces narbonensis]
MSGGNTARWSISEVPPPFERKQKGKQYRLDHGPWITRHKPL